MSLAEPLDELAILPTEYTKGLNFPPPDEIKIYDDTLRDGEQMPGVAFSPEQKLLLARALSDIGVHLMDIAFPGVSRGEWESIRLIAQARKKGELRENLELMVMARANSGDIDAAVEALRFAGLDPEEMSLIILSTTSDLHLKYKVGKTLLSREGIPESEWLSRPVGFYRGANLKMITSAIRHARRQGFRIIEFASEDCSRSHLEYTLKWLDECIRAGGSRMCFSDTVGVFTPEGVDHYFPPVVKAAGNIPVAAHFHNDFGIGAMNTVRALGHGARYASVTANGIGERAGNAPLHQVVMILRDLYGITIPGFKYEKLRELRRMIETFSGIVIQAHEPIIGHNVFSHESGIHVAGICNHPKIYQFIEPRVLGEEIRFVFGKHTGSAGVKRVLEKSIETLKKHGVEVTDELIRELTDHAKRLREAKTSREGFVREVTQYYDFLRSLGIQEEQIVEMAISREARVAKTDT